MQTASRRHGHILHDRVPSLPASTCLAGVLPHSCFSRGFAKVFQKKTYKNIEKVRKLPLYFENLLSVGSPVLSLQAICFPAHCLDRCVITCEKTHGCRVWLICLGWTSSQTALLWTLLLIDGQAVSGTSCVGVLQLSLPATFALPHQTGGTWE